MYTNRTFKGSSVFDNQISVVGHQKRTMICTKKEVLFIQMCLLIKKSNTFYNKTFLRSVNITFYDQLANLDELYDDFW
jgi:hypothetical protein